MSANPLRGWALIVLAVFVFAMLALIVPLVRDDVYKFQFTDLPDATRRDPATAAWFPATFPKSAQDIRGETHTDTNSIWVSFTYTNQADLPKGAKELTRDRVDGAVSSASKFDPAFGMRERISYYEFRFTREGDTRPTLAYLAIDKDRLRGLMWYTLQKE